MHCPTPRHPLRLLALAVSLLAVGTIAQAGQVRVNVSNFMFSPATVSLNLGDHAVWVWTGGGHTVTSGDPLTATPDGKFNAGTASALLSRDSSFSWKSTFTGTQKYFCIPHAPDMAGQLDIVASGAVVSDFRITEIQFNAGAGQSRIEICNLGANGDFGLYRLKLNGVPVKTLRNSGISPGAETIAIASGACVVVHVNATGTNTNADLFLPGIADLGATGSVALFVPNTHSSNGNDADQLIDFVQWGAGGQENETAAVSDGFWAAGVAIPNTVAAGHSVEFCGGSGQYGVGQWSEISTPTFGTLSHCVTPGRVTTWGRIKSLYR